MIAITICATKSFTYAMRAQARLVCANISACKGADKGVVVIVGDTSPELRAVHDLYGSILPEGWSAKLINRREYVENGESYKVPAQILIANMRTEAFARARQLGADYCWSLDSDVLPPANALRCSMNSLQFDDGYYSVATCPYPNAAFLGGFGTKHNPISEDFLPHERKLPDELKAEFEANEAELKALVAKKEEPTQEMRDRWKVTNEKIKACPPDGTIWQVIAKHGWRRRGWLDNAYPAIGRGSMVPSDWCGFGCTLLNREALALATFDGYNGAGTEDLFICWHRWAPAGIRINVITHCPCDHVIWDGKKNGDAGKFTHHQAYHETDGEYAGHLRVRQAPWHQFA
jgi:hypothetical protein